jgi:hypothetical protein
MKATTSDLTKNLPAADIRVLDIRKKRVEFIGLKIDATGKISVKMHERWRADLSGVEQDVEGMVLTELPDLDFNVKDLYDAITAQAVK